jgi:hypothetical protein
MSPDTTIAPWRAKDRREALNPAETKEEAGFFKIMIPILKPSTNCLYRSVYMRLIWYRTKKAGNQPIYQITLVSTYHRQVTVAHYKLQWVPDAICWPSQHLD